MDWVIWDPKFYESGCRRRTYEEVSIQPLKFQSIWPTLYCERSLRKSTVQRDPRGISLGWGGTMEILLLFLQTQWIGWLRCRVVSEETWRNTLESTSTNHSSSRGKHTNARKGQEEYCWSHGGREKMQFLSRSTSREISYGYRGKEATMRQENQVNVEGE